MRCPTPCYLCSELTELDDLQFNTSVCYCPDGCTHGICWECMADRIEAGDDELLPDPPNRADGDD